MPVKRFIVVLVTTKNPEEAEKITGELLDKKLAACVNIIDSVKSYFCWKGKLEIAKEALMIIKTTEAAFEKLKKSVKSLHSYEVPEIIALPVTKGNKEYLDWVKESVIR